MNLSRVPADYACAVAVVGVVAALAVIGRLSDTSRSSLESVSALKAAKALVHQAAEWHGMAAQDESPLYAMRHASLALAYLTAARLVASDTSIQKSTGVEVHRTLQDYEEDLRKRTQKVSKSCRGASKGGTTSVTWL